MHVTGYMYVSQFGEWIMQVGPYNDTGTIISDLKYISESQQHADLWLDGDASLQRRPSSAQEKVWRWDLQVVRS